MFAKLKSPDTSVGRVYVLQITLDDGELVHKVGMCHSPRSTDRMMEILRSWFTQYRYVPLTRLRLDFETGVPLLVEKHMHDVLSDWQWVPDKKVDGGQEMFKGLDEVEVIRYIKEFDYSVLLKGKVEMDSDDYKYICQKTSPYFDPTIDIPY
jgi:hypothetical protein